ncbi:MAG TPA: carbohydrate kinase [Tangfeifania sp.]|nr:carbohydrate kinase [Tangfeifania sp.]
MKNNSFNKIICYGEVLWDMLPGGKQPGGAPMNVAIHLKKLGLNPTIVSRIGNDEPGIELKHFLEKWGLDTRFVAIDQNLNTSEVLVHLDENRNATYEICEPVAWDNLCIDNDLLKLATDADLIIFGSLAQRNKVTRKTLLKLLENSKANRLLDVNMRPPFDKPEIVEQLLHVSDFAKLNDEELIGIAAWHHKNGSEKELIKWLAEFYSCPTVCVTRGANGAILFVDGKFHEHPGFKVKATDTVGAGDSFLAALISGFSEKKSPQKALEFACAVGAYVASQHGAVPDYREQDIQKLIL